MTLVFALWGEGSAAGADEPKPQTLAAAPPASPRRPHVAGRGPQRRRRPPVPSTGRRSRGRSLRSQYVPRSTKPLPGEPWLVWEENTSDFGRKLFDGTRIQGEFTFQNRGEADLHLTKVQPGCGCTAVTYDHVVKPGGTGHIQYSIDPFRFLPKNRQGRGADEGKGTKSIKVYADCPGHPYTVLRVTGQLYTNIKISPRPPVAFRRISPKEAITKTLSLIAKPGKPFEIVKVESDSPRFKASFDPVQKGTRYLVKLTTVPPMEVGYNAATITVTTTLDDRPQVLIPTRALCITRVYASPQKIPLRPDARAHSRVIRVGTRSGPVVRIKKATVSDPAIKIKMVQDPKTRREYVELFIPANYEIPADGTVVTIETNDEEYKTLRIPFVAQDGRTRSAKPQSQKAKPAAATDAKK